MPTIPKNQNLKIENLIKRNKRIIPFSGLFYLFLKKNLAWLPGWSCPVRHATGMPCPTCFLTRSITASLNGDISDALHFHVLGPPTTIFLVSWAFLSLKSGLFYPFKIRKNRRHFSINVLFIYWSFNYCIFKCSSRSTKRKRLCLCWFLLRLFNLDWIRSIRYF